MVNSCTFEFSGAAKSGLHDCPSNLRPDTVLLVEVSPSAPVRLKQLGFNKRDFRAFDLSQQTKGYIDDKSGLILKMYK